MSIQAAGTFWSCTCRCTYPYTCLCTCLRTCQCTQVEISQAEYGRASMAAIKFLVDIAEQLNGVKPAAPPMPHHRRAITVRSTAVSIGYVQSQTCGTMCEMACADGMHEWYVSRMRISTHARVRMHVDGSCVHTYAWDCRRLDSKLGKKLRSTHWARVDGVEGHLSMMQIYHK